MFGASTETLLVVGNLMPDQLARLGGRVCWAEGCGMTDYLGRAEIVYTITLDAHGRQNNRLGWWVRTCPTHRHGRRAQR